mgnify:CR=1 FL=1
MKTTYRKGQVIISFKLAGGLEALEAEAVRLMKLDWKELYGPAPKGPGARQVVKEMGQRWLAMQASSGEEEEVKGPEDGSVGD